MNGGKWTRPELSLAGLRFTPQDEGVADLAEDQEPAGRAELLLGHRKLENTVRYLGIELDDALEMTERTEC
jgi:hypothetical protein